MTFQCDHDLYTPTGIYSRRSFYFMHTCIQSHCATHTDLSDSTQQHTLHSMEENASLFTDDAATPCDFNITNQNSVTKIQMIPAFLIHQNNPAFTHKVNTHTERLLVNQIYSIMILTFKTH